MIDRTRSHVLRRLLLGTLLVGLLLAAPIRAFVPPPVKFGFRAVPLPVPNDPSTPEQLPSELLADFPDAAPLNVDDDLARSLARITDLLERDRTLDAVRSWQQLLDGMAGAGPLAGNKRLRSFRSDIDEVQRFVVGGSVYARYGSVRTHVERLQRSLDADGRKDYLLETGADAERLWDDFERTGEAGTLRAIVARYFNGTRGDDAALLLAARSLDRGDPAEAFTLLERIRLEHPNPSVDPSAVLARLVVAAARLGDIDGATGAWEELDERDALGAALASIVRDEVRRATERGASLQGVAGTSWSSGMGTDDGLRIAPSLPATSLHEQVTESWSVPYGVRPEDVAPPGVTVGLPGGAEAPRPYDAPYVVPGWTALERSPVAHVVAADGRVYMRGADRILCCDGATGRVLWMGRRSSSTFETMVRTYAAKVVQFQHVPRLPDNDELSRFCDRIPAEFSVDDDRLFAIEGTIVELGVTPPPVQTATQRRGRSNFLVAYDTATGRQLWRRRADEPEAEMPDSGFLGSAVADGEQLLVPTTQGGEVWVLGLDRETGETLWRTFVCDEPFGGVSHWSPVRIVVAEHRAYVLAGTGLVTSLDATTGDVRWAVRYQRATSLDLTREDRVRMRTPAFDFYGWDEETLLNAGRFLIVAPSDTDRLFALDRRNGAVAWEASAKPFDDGARTTSILGIVGDRLVAAGHDVLRQYEVSTGRLVWQTKLTGTTGRGIVTPEAIYVPNGNTLAVHDLATGRPIRQIAFASPYGKPLGNLASDGERLYAAGVTRALAIVPLPRHLEQLAGRIERGDADARLDRARLFAHLERHDEAFADLLAAAESVHDPRRDRVTAAAVLRVANQLEFGRVRPKQVLGALIDDGLGRIPGVEGDEYRELVVAWNAVAHDCLLTLGRESIHGATDEVLAVSARSNDEYLRSAVRVALAETVTPDDLPRLFAATETEGPVRTAAIYALAAKSLEEAEGVGEKLEEIWLAGEPHDKLAAAETLLARGDRSSLGKLVELLANDDVGIRGRASLLLQLSTGERIVFDPRGSLAQRGEAVIAWAKWVDESGATAELRTSIVQPRLLHGRTLVSNASQGYVAEFDLSNREVWRVAVPQLHGCWGTAGGQRIVSSYTGKFFIVYEAGDGPPKIAWRKDGLQGRPYSVQGLPTGNVLVAFYDTGAIHEYDRTGEIVWQATLKGSIADARRLPDGRTLATWYGQNAVVELDPQGEIVHRFDNMNGPRSAQRLPNGNTLVSQYRSSQVVEVDPKGAVVWSRTGVSGVQSAQRLPNGNTLIVHRAGVLETRRDGTPAWELKGSGYSRIHRY